jgi:hypothetical protein
MKNINTRFVAGSAVMTVYLRNGKRGINVAASVKTKGKKAVTYSRQVFNDIEKPAEDGTSEVTIISGLEQAKTAFDALKADAIEKGWTERMRAVAKPRIHKDRTDNKPIPRPDELTAEEKADADAIGKDLEQEEKPADAKVDPAVMDAANALTDADIEKAKDEVKTKKSTKKNRK